MDPIKPSRCHALQFIACPQLILPVDVDATADLAWPPQGEVVSGDWITGLELSVLLLLAAAEPATGDFDMANVNANATRRRIPRACLRPRPGGPAAPVSCNLPCLWSWPASEPGKSFPSSPLETTKTLISLEPSSWWRTRAILGGGRVARAGSGGKGKLLRARPHSPLPL
jgi:hypothetical protein